MFYIPNKKEIYLNSSLINLRPLSISDCNKRYLSWLNNNEVNKYLETRWTKHSISSIKEYVSNINKSKNNIILAIEDKTSKKHIGNIKLGPINFYHKFSEISYFIGEQNFWGKGYGTEAVKLMSKFSLFELKIEYLLAGVYENNKGSAALLKKLGYTLQGKFKKQLLNNNNIREDHLWFGLGKEDFLKSNHN